MHALKAFSALARSKKDYSKQKQSNSRQRVENQIFLNFEEDRNREIES